MTKSQRKIEKSSDQSEILNTLIMRMIGNEIGFLIIIITALLFSINLDKLVNSTLQLSVFCYRF